MDQVISVFAGLATAGALWFAASDPRRPRRVALSIGLAATYLALAVTALVLGADTPLWVLGALIGGGVGILASFLTRSRSVRRAG